LRLSMALSLSAWQGKKIPSFSHLSSFLPSLSKDLIGLGPFQFFLLVIAGLGFAADCMEVTLMSFLGQGVGKEWGLSTQTCNKEAREGRREGGREGGGDGICLPI